MPCTVRIPSALQSYTDGASRVAAEGATVGAVLAHLEARFPGIRFRMIDEQQRIRPHMRLFVNTAAATDLPQAVRAGDTVHVICALSGG
jgi:sulfur-carrier protein